MVTNNKVLTVSYGAFSCTLEGFDDAFGTMKIIAEYFRDLAAEDRYFGAEPPAPDAEMLAKIAEKEIARRVSARMDQGRIVLSTAAADVAEVAETPSVAPAETSIAEIEPDLQQTAIDTAEEVAEPTTDAENAEDTTGAAAPEPLDSDAVEAEVTPVEPLADAADIMSEDMAHEPPAETPVLEPSLSVTDSVLAAIADDRLAIHIDATEGYVEDHIESDAEDMPIDLGAIAAVIQADDTIEESAAAPGADVEEEDFFEPSAPIERAEFTEEAPFVLKDALPQDSDPVDDEALDLSEWEEEDVFDSAAYEENSISAKLERIRAVVSRKDVTPESAPADATPAESALSEEETLAPEMAHFEEEDSALYQEVTPADPDVVAEVIEAETQADTPDAEIADVQEAAQEEERAEAEAFVTEVEALEAEAEAYPEPETEAEAETPAGDTEIQPVTARVVRMKKADFEAAVAAGLLEAEPVEEDEAEDDTAQPQINPDSSLTPEDEAELLAELALVQEELKDSAQRPDDFDITGTDQEEAAMAQEMHKPEPDLSRLMAKADSEMQEPVGKGRRSAIAHLRAAVAATRAETSTAPESSSPDDTSPYRLDLANVVRGPMEEQPEELAGARSATNPLQLVAAQRVDAAAPSPETSAPPLQKAPRRIPVRPRRISAEQVTRDDAAQGGAPAASTNDTSTGFMDYADSVEATHLPESVEAAAAFLTYVQGLDRFTRPMIMRLAREANVAQFTREEGLRSFGQLLREKKIEKLAGGRFTATQAIGFKPRDREVG